MRDAFCTLKPDETVFPTTPRIFAQPKAHVEAGLSFSKHVKTTSGLTFGKRFSAKAGVNKSVKPVDKKIMRTDRILYASKSPFNPKLN